VNLPQCVPLHPRFFAFTCSIAKSTKTDRLDPRKGRVLLVVKVALSCHEAAAAQRMHATPLPIA
jgi:glutathione peroxidase-family protein